MHEMGHKLGLDDSYAAKDRDNLMYGYLTVGERRIPSKGQAANATPNQSVAAHFLSLVPSVESGRQEAEGRRQEPGVQPQSGAMFIAPASHNDSQLRRSEIESTNIALLRSAGSELGALLYKHSVPTGLQLHHATKAAIRGQRSEVRRSNHAHNAKLEIRN